MALTPSFVVSVVIMGMEYLIANGKFQELKDRVKAGGTGKIPQADLDEMARDLMAADAALENAPGPAGTASPPPEAPPGNAGDPPPSG